MANIGKWNASTGVITMLSTELTALGSSTISAASTTYDNSVNLNIYCDVEVVINCTGTPVSGSYVALYIWEAIDGTNFPAQSDADLRLTTTQLFCTIPIGVTANSAQRVVVRNLVLPPAKFQFKLDNQIQVVLSSTTSNTVRMIPYNINLNG
jgi:hypothetical protein